MLTETQTPAVLSRQLSSYIVHTLPATSNGKAGESILLAVKQHLPYAFKSLQLDRQNGTIWLTLKPTQSQQTPLTLGVCYPHPASFRSAQLRSKSAQARYDSLAAQLSDASADGHVLLAGDFNAGWAATHNLGF